MHQYAKYRCYCEWIYSLLIQWNLNVKLGNAVWHYSAPTRSFSRATLEMHVKLYFIVLVVIVSALLWTIAVQCCCFSFSCLKQRILFYLFLSSLLKLRMFDLLPLVHDSETFFRNVLPIFIDSSLWSRFLFAVKYFY